MLADPGLLITILDSTGAQLDCDFSGKEGLTGLRRNAGGVNEIFDVIPEAASLTTKVALNVPGELSGCTRGSVSFLLKSVGSREFEF